MTDDRPSFPIELMPGGRDKIVLDDEDVLAFRDWQKLSREEKQAILWMAGKKDAIEMVVHHKVALRAMIATYYWLSQTGQVLLKLGAIAGVVLSAYAVIKLFNGGS